MKPPAVQPINWRLIRDTLWQWFSEAAGVDTIWEDQAAPQPPYPYASLNILPGATDFGALDETRIQTDGSIWLVGPRDFVLSCQIHVGPTASDDPFCDARIRADSAVACLAVPEFQYALRQANIGLRERGQVQMLDLEIGAEWIKRSQVDLRFGTMSVVKVADWPNLSEIGWFNKVEASSDIQGLLPTSDLNWDEEILDPSA